MADVLDMVGSVDMYELACKTNDKVALNSEEKDLTAELDAAFKEIGN